MDAVLKAAGLKKYYGKGEALVKALDGVDLEIERGKFTAIIGTSGSGKSTLLNMLGGLDTPTEGSIRIGNTELAKLTSEEATVFRRKQIGFIFQGFNLIPALNAWENVELPLIYQGVPASKRADRVEAALERVGLAERAGHKPTEMSGGQQQRVSIARAIATQPPIIMADEPTGALDSRSAKLLLDRFEALNREGRATILMVTHDAFTASYCRRILFLQDGAVLTQLERGGQSRRAFFQQIIGVVTRLGGDQSDVL